jgi:hypothetical protein
MSPSPSKNVADPRAVGSGARPVPSRNLAGLTLAGWLVPGAAHAIVGEFRKALVFFVVLTVMFAFGIVSGGRLFPFVPSDPLLFLAALAEWALGLPHLIASFVGAGRGEVVTATYEYGNTFLIVAGLLNALVVLDACDVSAGRKAS